MYYNYYPKKMLKLWQQIEFTTKHHMFGFKFYPNPANIYTIQECVDGDVFQVWWIESHKVNKRVQVMFSSIVSALFCKLFETLHTKESSKSVCSIRSGKVTTTKACNKPFSIIAYYSRLNIFNLLVSNGHYIGTYAYDRLLIDNW